jgi:hypothetical protein
MAWVWREFAPVQMMKKSVKEVCSRKSRTRTSEAFLDSAARTAICHGSS